MPAKHLWIGLDGADLNLVRALGPAVLPHLHRAMAQGVHGPLRCVQPIATLPNWTTQLTAFEPGVHGVFDFCSRQGYQVAFRGGLERRIPTLFTQLDALGMPTAAVGFPGTWPPEPLQHGLFISGWDSPVAFQADPSFVHPRPLWRQLTARFGPLSFAEADEFRSDEANWHAALPAQLTARIARRTEMAEWLLAQRDWQLFAFYFGESDTAAHHLWNFHDPHSPRHPDSAAPAACAGLRKVYQALDAALGQLWQAAGGDVVELTVSSDHGSGGSSDKVLYLNRVLADAGLLRLRPRAARLSTAMKALALSGLSPALKEQLFRWQGGVLPGRLESSARFGAIDMAHSVAFSDELNYFPAVHLNLRGREPEGIVSASEACNVKARVQEALLSLRDPWSGQPVVAAVWQREALFEGPAVERAPDLLLELQLDAGYSYNLMPSSTAPAHTGPWRRLTPAEYCGRKGRSLAGSHRDHGLWIAAGPRVRPGAQVDARMADVPATLLQRMQIAPPADSPGRVLWGALHDDDACPQPLPPSTATAAQPRAPRTGRVLQRLQALGYVD